MNDEDLDNRDTYLRIIKSYENGWNAAKIEILCLIPIKQQGLKKLIGEIQPVSFFTNRNIK